jgi:penicillin-binding protein 1A
MRTLVLKLVAVIAGTSLVLAAAAAAMAVPAGLLDHLGSGDPPPIKLGPLSQRSYVYASNGQLMATLQDEENRQPIPLRKIPPHVIAAVLAVEDAGFYVHDGYNIRGMLRAFRANVDSGGISQGGSTITQQLVKLNILGSKQTVDRKVQEVVLASRLEKQMTKEQILSRYLNTVYFGNHAYGVQAAAETYFGISASKLDVGQAAMLAGIIRNPINYNPVRYPKRAMARRDVAIDRMYAVGAIDRKEQTWWHAAPTLPQIHQVLPKPNDYFADEVKKHLLADKRLGATPAQRRKAIFEGGLKVYTTFDPVAQAYAVQARDANLPLVNGVFSQPGVDEHGRPNLGSAAVVSVEPATGAVRTMVGGPGFDNYHFNLATQNRRQVGSSFKTYVLATIMEQGKSPNDIINGLAPCTFTNPGGAPNPYKADNFADGSGGVGTVTDATLKSSNCAFVRLGLIAGGQNVANMAHRLGIPEKIQGKDPLCGSCPSMPLGVASLTPLQMASAYSTIANDGVYNAPYFIDKVVDRNGRVIIAHQHNPQRRISSQTARLVTSILQQNVQRGTGTRAQIGAQPAAGKTGTAQASRDGWFIGYTPALATAVWVGGLGHEYTIRLRGELITGGHFAAPIWGTFMRNWQASRPVVGFPAPTPVAPSAKPLEVPGGRDLTPAPAPKPPAPPPRPPIPGPIIPPNPTPTFIPFPVPGRGNGGGPPGRG